MLWWQGAGKLAQLLWMLFLYTLLGICLVPNKPSMLMEHELFPAWIKGIKGTERGRAGKGNSKSIYSLKSDISWKNSSARLQLQAVWFPLQPVLQLCFIPSSCLQIKSAMCATLLGLGVKNINCRKLPSDSDSWGLACDPSNPSVLMAFQKSPLPKGTKAPFFGNKTISPMLHDRPLANELC